MNRIQLLNQHVSPQQTAAPSQVRQPKGNFTDCWTHLKMNEYLTENGRKLKESVGDIMKAALPDLIPYHEKKEFPMWLVNIFQLQTFLLNLIIAREAQQVGYNGMTTKGFGSPGLNTFDAYSMLYEFGRWDGSVALFMFLHNSLGIKVIEELGSEDQKQRIIPGAVNFKNLMCFGLTEPENGSDATNLSTTAKKVEGGYLLNGKKRWPGNANLANYSIMWAKNISDGNKIQGFIIEKGQQGYKVDIIPNKAALRMVQNCEIEMKDVFVPDHNRLAKAEDFVTGLNTRLMEARISITWIFIGQMAGAFEAAYNYAMNRVQFGKPIAGFQIQQERMVRMLGEMESSMMLLVRLTQLYERGEATIGQIAIGKAHISRVARDVTRAAREMQGANGMLWENQALKHMMDMEGAYTGEGTYDINCLVAGREITGMSAFK